MVRGPVGSERADMQSRPSLEVVPPALETSRGVDLRSTAHPETGVHDAMRHGPRSMHAETSAASFHPVQNRLEKWDETQRNWKLAVQRNTFGLGMPVRTMMERKLVAQNPHFPARRAADVHLDVLDGKDETLDPVDFLPSGVSGESLDIHTPMERKVGL